MDRKMIKMADSQKLLLWSQFFSLEPMKVKENNIIGFYIRIKDGDPKTLEQAYNKVIQTNDSLRLRFRHSGLLGIRQYIEAFHYIPLPVRRLDSDQAFQTYLDQIHRYSLPMYGPRLTWAEIVMIPGENAILVMRFHHLIIDGYSIALIFRRIAEAYEQYKNGKEPEPAQYSVLRVFEQERQYKKSSRHAEDWRYWLRNFNLQPHYSFPAGHRSEFGACARQNIEISGCLYHEAMALAMKSGCSIQSIIMSAAAYTTYLITRKTNFCIYSLTHGRYDRAAKQTVGCLVNTIPVFYNLDPRRSISDTLKDDYLNFLDALKHGRLSMSEQTLLSYKEALLHGFNFNHAWLIISSMEYGAAFSQSVYEGNYILSRNQPHQFYCSLLEIPGEKIEIGLGYQTRKYTARQVDQVLQLFLEVIHGMILTPEAPLVRLAERVAPGRQQQPYPTVQG
ncbi:MAG: condensation domain-containing protein [Clostridiaceae bacterium]|nr:condensation domain-containing protein [Clostridiaceae bacterium]